MKQILDFFDKLEDVVHGKLSRHPIPYALLGGTALVLFWRGVWHTADLFPFMTGPVSLVVSVPILLMTGLFVSFFITDRVILSGLRHDRKVGEKTFQEVRREEIILSELHQHVVELTEEVRALREGQRKPDSPDL